MPGSALQCRAVFEGVGQETIRVGCGVVQRATPELFAEGGNTPSCCFRIWRKSSIVSRRSRMLLICYAMARFLASSSLYFWLGKSKGWSMEKVRFAALDSPRLL